MGALKKLKKLATSFGVVLKGSGFVLTSNRKLQQIVGNRVKNSI